MKYHNISSYKFVSLDPDTLPSLRDTLLEQALKFDIKGSILLSTEGINLFIAAKEPSLTDFTDYLKTKPEFSNLWFKLSESDHVPFKRMFVRIKNEIISMKQP